MKLLKLAFKPGMAIPMVGLVFASGTSVLLDLARVLVTGRAYYGFLIWNLFLAWLPMVLALFACDAYQRESGKSWRFRSLAAAWLLFFPNAPYIFTDVIHLTSRLYAHFWVDLVLVLTCALIGLVVGFVSLFVMQSVVSRMFGRIASWLFIAAVAGLSGFGVYIGRFLRFNSWDVLFKPMTVARGLGNWATNSFSDPASLAFPALFATFLFIAYVMIYALTHLQPAHAFAAAAPARQTPSV